jgi:replicative DNA helicase
MEAEQSVIGGLLLNNKAWPAIVAALSEDDFYTQDHRIIFRAMTELFQSGRPCDFVTLSEHLRQQNRLEEAGGVSYLGTLAADTPSAANVEAYAGIVKERSTLRALIAAGQDIAELGYQPGARETAVLIEEARRLIRSLGAPQKECCGSCKYFRDGGCHIDKPGYRVISNQTVSVWPPVTAAQWCGKFKKK